MKYREFGRTGLQVSDLVFGGGAVGGLLVNADDDTKLAAIRQALAGGINWIDTAPRYGQGRSETALGWLLREVEETPYLSTKVRIDIENLSDIPGQIERSLTESFARLKRDSVDLVQLHNPIHGETGGAETASGSAIGLDAVLGKDGVAEGLERARTQGLTRFIGLTALGEAGAVCEAVRSGRFDSAQVYHNLINPTAARGLRRGGGPGRLDQRRTRHRPAQPGNQPAHQVRGRNRPDAKGQARPRPGKPHEPGPRGAEVSLGRLAVTTSRTRRRRRC